MPLKPTKIKSRAKEEQKNNTVNLEEECFPEPEHTQFSDFIRSIEPLIKQIEDAHNQSRKTDEAPQ